MKMDVIEQIQDKCKEFEEKNGFKILFAIESGSRLWGMSSENSDYDVHLVFYYPVEKYLSLKKPKDVITWMSDDRLVDINGFDIYKFTKLLLKSNPNILDWIMSDIIYYGDKEGIPKMRDFAQNKFNPVGLYQAYFGIAHNTMKLIVKGRETVKKYLYVLRGILNAQWVLENNTLPPFKFDELVDGLELPEEFVKTIKQLIENKRNGSENMRIGDEINIIEPFIQKKFEERDLHLEKLTTRRTSKNVIKELDLEIRQLIENWENQ